MAIECTANNLAALAACFDGLTPVQQSSVKIYLLAVAAGVSPDPATLVAAAKCFDGLTSVQQGAAQNYLLCQASQS